MDYLILTDTEGGTATLKTNSPASHYGIPILRIDASDVVGDFGPADLIATEPKPLSAAVIVAAWGGSPERTPEEREAARKYLCQWPNGPQLLPMRDPRITGAAGGRARAAKLTPEQRSESAKKAVAAREAKRNG
jgi:hypothetical protein